MKKLRRTLAVILTVILTMSVLFTGASAAFPENTNTVLLVSYNVAGLPNYHVALGEANSTLIKDQTMIGEQLNEYGADLIFTQEDFGANSYLYAPMTNYLKKTVHTGGVPGGDGMNIYSRYAKIYNESRTTWDKAYGVIEDGADELTPKGILHAVINIAKTRDDDGNIIEYEGSSHSVMVDFYNIHADAYGDEGSIEARADNFRQLAEMVNYYSKKTGRPAIVTGDFNTSSHLGDGVYFNQYLIEGCGLKDAWIERYNNGWYDNFDGYSGEYWGVWDSVEKFLYKDGKDVQLILEDFSYNWFYSTDEHEHEQRSLSDHAAACAIFSYEITSSEHKDDVSNLQVNSSGNIIKSFFTRLLAIIKDIFKIFTNFSTLVQNVLPS